MTLFTLRNAIGVQALLVLVRISLSWLNFFIERSLIYLSVILDIIMHEFYRIVSAFYWTKFHSSRLLVTFMTFKNKTQLDLCRKSVLTSQLHHRGTERDIEKSRRFGFVEKLDLHPSEIPMFLSCIENAQNRGVASTGFIPTPVTRNTGYPGAIWTIIWFYITVLLSVMFTITVQITHLIDFSDVLFGWKLSWKWNQKNWLQSN